MSPTPSVPAIEKQFKVKVRLPKSSLPTSKTTTPSASPQAPPAQATTPAASPQAPPA